MPSLTRRLTWRRITNRLSHLVVTYDLTLDHAGGWVDLPDRYVGARIVIGADVRRMMPYYGSMPIGAIPEGERSP